METYRYPQFPPSLANVYVALLTEVSNAAQLRARLVKAATMVGPEGEAERDVLNFAFVDARLICSRSHLMTAIYHAILAQVQGSLRTKTVHSEILWALNPTNNITEALRRYGVSDDSRSLFVVRIDNTMPAVQERITSLVEGKLSPLSDLVDITDWASIRKYNKLNGEPALKATEKDIIRQKAVIDGIVTSAVAMKSVMA